MDLEPPAFEIVAEWIRDQTWLDMRVCDQGMFERVMPTAVTVHRDRDELHCCQEYLLEERIVTDRFDFDCEDIMWWRPSILTLDDVEPRAPTLAQPDIDHEPEYLAGEILETVSFLTGHSVQAIKDDNDCSYDRQLCIRLLWECSKLGAGRIPQMFGYHSGGMFTHSMRRTANEAATVKRAYALLETRVGHRLPFVRGKQGPRGRQKPVAAVPTAQLAS